LVFGNMAQESVKGKGSRWKTEDEAKGQNLKRRTLAHLL
jgi:hypothetical protein